MFNPSDAQITNTALKTKVKPHNNLIIRINFIRLCYHLNVKFSMSYIIDGEVESKNIK